MQNNPNLKWGWLITIGVVLLVVVGLYAALTNSSDPPASSKTASTAKSTPGTQFKGTKRDRIPINTICYLGPAGVFDTNDDVTLFMEATINGDHFAANNMLSDDFHFWLRYKANVKVLYHGPYQGYVAPDAPKSTRDALSQFEICQIEILDGSYKNKIGWVVDTELRCPTQKGR